MRGRETDLLPSLSSKPVHSPALSICQNKSQRGSESERARDRDMIRETECDWALAGWLSWLGHRLIHQKFEGLIPGRATNRRCAFNPLCRHVWEANNRYFSLFPSPFLSLKSINISLGEGLKKRNLIEMKLEKKSRVGRCNRAALHIHLVLDERMCESPASPMDTTEGSTDWATCWTKEHSSKRQWKVLTEDSWGKKETRKGLS